MMIRALWSGATGMQAQQFNIDSIAHDLTNVNTAGFKKTHVNFADLFYQNLRAAGLQGESDLNTPVGVQVGHGVRVMGTTPVFTQGGAIETGIPTNMRLVDRGNVARSFFGVTKGDEVYYSRDGSFRLNDEGLLTTSDGLPIEPPIGAIPPDAIEITVSPEGRVLYRLDGEADPVEAGRINLFTFQNPAGLTPVGDNLWRQTPASGDAVQGEAGEEGFATIQGGWLETSNVDAIGEMVNMIAAQRAYEFNSRSIQTSDEMLQTVNTLKR